MPMIKGKLLKLPATHYFHLDQNKKTARIIWTNLKLFCINIG
jgi:hypothetical protein